MNNICVWLERVLGWLEASHRVPLLYVGPGRQYQTAPAPYLELVYMQEGLVSDMVMGDLHVSIPAGQMVLHNVHFGNYAPLTDRFSAWCLFLDISQDKSFDELKERPLFLSAPVKHSQPLIRAFKRLQRRSLDTEWVAPTYTRKAEYIPRRRESQTDRTTDILLKTALLELVALMLREGQAGGTEQAVLPEPVRQALDYMQSNYENASLTLADVAGAAHLSVDHFGRLFKTHMGDTPMHHLCRIRISQSGFLLRHTDLRLAAISASVGYNDVFHFSRTFKQICGCSPKEYRRPKESLAEAQRPQRR